MLARPELSLAERPLRERILDLAEVICRLEVDLLRPWGDVSGGLAYKWIPISPAAFAVPIALKRVVLSHKPEALTNFSVVNGDFGILGDDEMSLSVSRQMREEDFPDDAWNRDFYNRFLDSYQNHAHDICESELSAQKQQLAELTPVFVSSCEQPGYTTIDRRGLR